MSKKLLLKDFLLKLSFIFLLKKLDSLHNVFLFLIALCFKIEVAYLLKLKV